MEILEYDDVDPVSVLNLNMLALDFPLTPEHVAHIRHSDPRPFPFLAVYAVEDGEVLGQVGVFRLPMISSEGREDVGGIWAVSTHPQHSGKGIASRLLDEAHKRMREAGLRFSTLGTDRYRVAHKLYRQHGYEETNVLATAMARWETAHQPTRLRTQPPGSDGHNFVEKIYRNISKDYLGFAWRHTPFSRLSRVSLEDLWIVWDNTQPVGYAIAHINSTILKINNLTLRLGVNAEEAVAAIAAELKSSYVQVKISRPVEITSFQGAGYHVAHPTWDGFMIKSLIPNMTAEDGRQLFGIGTDRFLISWLDVTS